MTLYLCYDIRGIQSFIFKIPKLKYIIGGSALIDEFDRETVKGLNEANCKCLFAGGGKGTFVCKDDKTADRLQQLIIDKAHEIGLDIRFGRGENFEQASRNATELFPFIPDLFDGIPCPVSGLYPVKDKSKDGAKVGHKIVQKRMFKHGEKMFRWFENQLIQDDKDNHLFDLQMVGSKDVAFFHNVDADDSENREEGQAGARTLGNRNRWAIICMDGNDMGSQLRKMINSQQKENDSVKPDSEKMVAWVEKMSKSIDKCARNAATAGIKKVVEEWLKSNTPQEYDGTVILPIRPIVVGGDDIVVICHVSYAMSFVKEAIKVFNLTSKDESDKCKKDGMELWPSTGGELTISAGVLFCPVSLPLHTAIGYAESLLASAKSRGRREQTMPTPASIDWEQITDSIVDTPSARRQKEMMFVDNDHPDHPAKTVLLISRPCTLREFEEIEKLASYYKDYPATVRHKVLPAIRQGFYDRLAFVAEIAKHQPKLAGHLSERKFAVNNIKSKWKYYDADWQKIDSNIGEDEFQKRVKYQKTEVIDALLLLEEGHRMEKDTVNHQQEQIEESLIEKEGINVIEN